MIRVAGPMLFESPLSRATLIRRYQRFLADIRLEDGTTSTIHCPNTGSMTHCADEGSEVWYSRSTNRARKYPHTWELTKTGRGDWIGVNTARANGLVSEAIEAGVISELTGFRNERAEVRYGVEGSRIDLLLTDPVKGCCYVEVKSVTLLDESAGPGAGLFPDAVSARGRKHLRELMAVRRKGARAALVYCVQHSGVATVQPAAAIDPAYSDTLRQAAEEGVELLAYKAAISTREIALEAAVPVRL